MFGCGIMLSETCHFRLRWVRFGDCAALAVFGCSLTLAGLKGQPVFTEYCGPILSHSSFQLGFLFASTYALGYFALAGGGLLSQSLSWDWLRWFGNISYSYYLTHGVVLHSLRILLDFLHMPARLSPLPFLTLSIASFVATVAVSSIVFLAIEKRFSFPARAANVETTPRLRVTLS